MDYYVSPGKNLSEREGIRVHFGDADLEAIKVLHTHFKKRLTMFQSSSSDEITTWESDLNQLYKFSSDLYCIFESLTKAYPDSQFPEMLQAYGFIHCFYVQKNHALTLSKLLAYSRPVQHQEDTSRFSWPSFFLRLKRGQLQDCTKLLKNHPKRPAMNEFFQELEKCLDARYRFYGDPSYMRSEHDFIVKFEELKRNAAKLARQTKNEDYSEFLTLIEVLEGRLEMVVDKLELSWMEYLLLHVIFVDGIYHNGSNAIPVIFDRYRLDQFEELLIGLAQQNTLHSSLQECKARFPSYFVAHSIEALLLIYVIPISAMEELDGLTYPESFYLNYVEDLIEDVRIDFTVPADYIINTLGRLQNVIDLFQKAAAYRLPTATPGEVFEIVTYCNNNYLQTVAEFIYKEQANKFRSQDNIIEAFTWAINSSDDKFVGELSQVLREKAFEMSVDELKELVKAFNERVFTRSTDAYFLKKYCEFSDDLVANTHDSLREASQLLHEFLVIGLAPELFWGRVLEEGAFLFQQDDAVFDWKDLMLLIERLEYLTNPKLHVMENINVRKVSLVLTQAVVKSQISQLP